MVTFQEAVWSIIAKYNEDDWMEQCRAAFPEVSDEVFIRVIERLLGADIDDLWQE